MEYKSLIQDSIDLDYRRLLFGPMRDNDVWNTFFECITAVFKLHFEPKLKKLAILNDYDLCERDINVLNAKDLGFDLKNTLFTDDEYVRLLDCLRTYQGKKGTAYYLDILGVIEKARFTGIPLWTKDYKTFIQKEFIDNSAITDDYYLIEDNTDNILNYGKINLTSTQTLDFGSITTSIGDYRDYGEIPEYVATHDLPNVNDPAFYTDKYYPTSHTDLEYTLEDYLVKIYVYDRELDKEYELPSDNEWGIKKYIGTYEDEVPKDAKIGDCYKNGYDESISIAYVKEAKGWQAIEGFYIYGGYSPRFSLEDIKYMFYKVAPAQLILEHLSGAFTFENMGFNLLHSTDNPESDEITIPIFAKYEADLFYKTINQSEDYITAKRLHYKIEIDDKIGWYNKNSPFFPKVYSFKRESNACFLNKWVNKDKYELRKINYDNPRVLKDKGILFETPSKNLLVNQYGLTDSYIKEQKIFLEAGFYTFSCYGKVGNCLVKSDKLSPTDWNVFDVENYEYTLDTKGNLILTNYIGTDEDITLPNEYTLGDHLLNVEDYKYKTDGYDNIILTEWIGNQLDKDITPETVIPDEVLDSVTAHTIPGIITTTVEKSLYVEHNNYLSFELNQAGYVTIVPSEGITNMQLEPLAYPTMPISCNYDDEKTWYRNSETMICNGSDSADLINSYQLQFRFKKVFEDNETNFVLGFKNTIDSCLNVTRELYEDGLYYLVINNRVNATDYKIYVCEWEIGKEYEFALNRLNKDELKYRIYILIDGFHYKTIDLELEKEIKLYQIGSSYDDRYHYNGFLTYLFSGFDNYNDFDPETYIPDTKVLDLADYTYTIDENKNVILTDYIGKKDEVITPNIFKGYKEKEAYEYTIDEDYNVVLTNYIGIDTKVTVPNVSKVSSGDIIDYSSELYKDLPNNLGDYDYNEYETNIVLTNYKGHHSTVSIPRYEEFPIDPYSDLDTCFNLTGYKYRQEKYGNIIILDYFGKEKVVNVPNTIKYDVKIKDYKIKINYDGNITLKEYLGRSKEINIPNTYEEEVLELGVVQDLEGFRYKIDADGNVVVLDYIGENRNITLPNMYYNKDDNKYEYGELWTINNSGDTYMNVYKEDEIIKPLDLLKNSDYISS